MSNRDDYTKITPNNNFKIINNYNIKNEDLQHLKVGNYRIRV